MSTKGVQLEECVIQLEERAKPSKNDIRYERYVDYVNCFISKFGKEKVYLVGSTGERSKLAYFKDDGDADFLFVSGKLEITPENIRYNEHTPCYVRILADETSRNIGLEIVDNEYLSANSLRKFGPELFTLLRAVHSQITANVDKLPETDANITVVSVSSKVGLQLTNYRSLQFDCDINEHIQNWPRAYNDDREQERRDVAKRWEDVKVHEQDKKIYKRIYQVLKTTVPRRGKRENNGGIAFFAQFMEDAIKQQNMDLPIDADIYSRGEVHEDRKTAEDEFEPSKQGQLPELKPLTGIRATYKEKNYKDFVPALLIKGEMDCMNQWKRRVQKLGWPQSLVSDIYNTDVFVVARVAPVNPNSDVDFCLSFNLAENKMMKMLSREQRQVFLIVKAFIKGIFERNHRQKDMEMKFKTYHVKTLLFWLFEGSICKATGTKPLHLLLDCALVSLREKLLREELSHYFVQSNLFEDFGKEDFKILIECVDEVKLNPVLSVNYYIEMNDGKRGEVWFAEEELRCLLEMSADGGRSKHVNRLADAMVDFQRGINESQRDADGNAPLREAITDTFRLYLAEEGRLVDNKLFKKINDFLTKGEVDLRKLDKEEADKKIEATVVLVEGLQNEFPRIKHFLKQFGGIEGIIDILRGAFYGKAVDFNSNLDEQILETVDRYLACSDDEEEAHMSELKYKVAGYFLGRHEFSDLSQFRHK